jgi:hypothetical protein
MPKIICGGSLIRNRNITNSTGTANCLCLDRANPQRKFLLACAHVLAPPGVPIGDGICEIVEQDAATPIGKLIAFSAPADQIDVAVVELDAGVIVSGDISGLGVPAGVSKMLLKSVTIDLACGVSKVIPGQSIQDNRYDVRQPFMLNGVIDHWAFVAQVGCAPVVVEGDSGGVALNRARHLVGMVIGLTPDHTVITPMQAMLDFIRGQRGIDIAPVLTLGAAGGSSIPTGATFSAHPVPPAPAAAGTAPPWTNAILGSPPPNGGDPADAREILALTLWAEAQVDWIALSKNVESELGDLSPYLGVAEAIVNRARRGMRGRNIREVCLSRKQFSCWNDESPDGDSIRGTKKSKIRTQRDFKAADYVAQHAVDGWSSNLTQGATHYFADFIETPAWAEDKVPTVRIGHHLFFNDIPA